MATTGMGGGLRDLSERWLSVEEIAAYMGISRETIYKWLEKKSIPAHKIGRQWKFKASEVDQWVIDGRAADPRSKDGGGSHEK